MRTDRDDRACELPTNAPLGLEAAEVPRELDPEWDEAFAWSYGQRLWNVGCG